MQLDQLISAIQAPHAFTQGFVVQQVKIPDAKWFANGDLVLCPACGVAMPRQCATLSAFCALPAKQMTARSFSQTTMHRV